MKIIKPVKGDGLCAYYFIPGKYFSELAQKIGLSPLLIRGDGCFYMDENLYDEYVDKKSHNCSRYVCSKERLEVSETAFDMFMELVMSTHSKRYRKSGQDWEDIVFDDCWS